MTATSKERSGSESRAATGGQAELLAVLGEFRLAVARDLARSGRYADAIQELKAVSDEKESYRLRAAGLRARIYAQQGWYDKAAEQWSQVLSADPDDSGAVQGLAKINRLRKRSAMPHGYRLAAGAIIAATLAIVVATVMTMLGELKAVRSEVDEYGSETSNALAEHAIVIKGIRASLDDRIPASFEELHGTMQQFDDRVSELRKASAELASSLDRSHSSVLTEQRSIQDNQEKLQESVQALTGSVDTLAKVVQIQLESIRIESKEMLDKVNAYEDQETSIEKLHRQIVIIENEIARANDELLELKNSRRRRR